MSLKLTASAAALSLALAAMSAPAGATVITAGSGWQFDLIQNTNAPSTASPWEFTVASGQTADFRVTDAGTPGDLLYLFNHGGAMVASSSFFAGAALGGTVGDPTGEADWEGGRFSKIDYKVGPGSYSLDIYGDCAEGCPGAIYVRLDDPPGVPEPASWAMLIGGMAAVGGMLRGSARTRAA